MYDYFCGCDYAYVRPFVPWANIHLCGAAFGRSVNELAETIVHESKSPVRRHRRRGVLLPVSSGCSPSLSRTDAFDNADSFSKFALEAFTTIP
jgi:hypothetical protein